MTEKDEFFMRRAIELAQNGIDTNAGGPFGAVIVRDGEIIGEGWNQVTSTNDPTAHAEVVAIRKACAELNDFQLEGCTIYASCEPCPMCLGAIYWARAERLIYACTKTDAAEIGFDDRFIYEEIERHPGERRVITETVLREEGLKVFRNWAEKVNRIEY